MTEVEWQERYEITSIKGRIWKRSEIAKRAVDALRTLLPSSTREGRRAAVLELLDDPAFMRGRKGMVPARVVGDDSLEAMLRLMKKESV